MLTPFRRVTLFSCVIILLAGLAPVTPVSARDVPPSFADLVEKLSPAVVNISTTQKVKGGGVSAFGMPFNQLPDTPEMEPFRQFFDHFSKPNAGEGGKELPEREMTSLGSGFVIDASGFIITNNHVIDEAEEVTVTFSDNTKYKASIIGRDAKTDLALLKVESKKALPFVALGDSDAMRVGDWVIAIGNPYGLGGSVTQGIISARQRSINAGPFDDFLQTDAPINRGNSGGPLFNMSGEVIGINSAIFSPSGGNIGIGFAIPVALAKPVIAQLKEFGRTHRGWLGVKIQEVTDEMAESVGLAKTYGALVVDADRNGPAAKAGVQAGDIITHFDGKEVAQMRFLPRMVAETPIGKKVEMNFWRKGKSQSVIMIVGEMDESEKSADKEKPGNLKKNGKLVGETVLGLELVPLTPQLRTRFGMEKDTNGLLVLTIVRESEASKRGIAEGDVIAELNGEAVSGMPAFKAGIDAARKARRNFVLLKVLRKNEAVFVPLPVADEKKYSG